MATKQQEIVKDIRSAVRLEQELQVSYTQKGVVVVDVYSVEWGPCKAINETFRRLSTDQLDGTPLRFISAECHSILAAAKANEERNHQRPKNIEAVRETLPEAWLGVLEERAGLSKPYFLLYKEGKRVAAIEGVNTPLIRATVKDLCAVKVPASDSITNSKLLDCWEEHFNPAESEVAWEKFHKALYHIVGISEPLNDDEVKAVLDALHIKFEAKEKIVLADNLQKWVGDEDNSSLPTAFHALLPDYAARANQAKAERETEERRQEEERSAKAQESEVAEAAKAAADAKDKQDADEKRAAELNAEIAHLMSVLRGVKAAEDAIDTDASIAQRSIIAKLDTGDVRKYERKISFFSEDEARERAESTAKAFTEAGTFTDYIAKFGLEATEIENLRTACEAYFRSSNLLSAGKFAVLAASSTAEDSNKLFHHENDFYGDLCNNSLVTSNPALAKVLYTSGGTSVTDVEELYFVGPSSHVEGLANLEAGKSVVLNVLSLLDDVEHPRSDGDVSITFKGIPRAIYLQKISVRKLAQVASNWYLTFDVESNEEGKAVLIFQGTFAEDALDAQRIAKEQDDDDEQFNSLNKLRKAATERAALVAAGVKGANAGATARAEQPPASKKAESKPATPKTASVSEAPAEKVATPKDSKPATPVVATPTGSINEVAAPKGSKPATPKAASLAEAPAAEAAATPKDSKPTTPKAASLSDAQDKAPSKPATPTGGAPEAEPVKPATPEPGADDGDHEEL